MDISDDIPDGAALWARGIKFSGSDEEPTEAEKKSRILKPLTMEFIDGEFRWVTITGTIDTKGL
jgi:hypothetical protein